MSLGSIQGPDRRCNSGNSSPRLMITYGWSLEQDFDIVVLELLAQQNLPQLVRRKQLKIGVADLVRERQS
jgi:hypothetical protein